MKRQLAKFILSKKGNALIVSLCIFILGLAVVCFFLNSKQLNFWMTGIFA